MSDIKDLSKRLREKRRHPCCMHSTDEPDEQCQAAAAALEAAERVIAPMAEAADIHDESQIGDVWIKWPVLLSNLRAARDWLATYASDQRKGGDDD